MALHLLLREIQLGAALRHSHLGAVITARCLSAGGKSPSKGADAKQSLSIRGNGKLTKKKEKAQKESEAPQKAREYLNTPHGRLKLVKQARIRYKISDKEALKLLDPSVPIEVEAGASPSMARQRIEVSCSSNGWSCYLLMYISSSVVR
jgi:hypothetical protein